MNLYLNEVQQLIKETALASGRKPEHILLVAVSKQQSIEAIKSVFQLGIHHFGESYLQEAEKKINSLNTLPLCWHFIGPIQSNKTKGIANLFHWVHSISRLKIAQDLDKYCCQHAEPLNVCLQINLLDEKNKSGVLPHQARELALAVSQLPHLKLRGLMTIPPPQKDPQQQYAVFLQLNRLMHSLNQELQLAMDTLSMGMSDDLVPAIQAGATIVRVGRAIWGKKDKSKNEGPV